MVFILVVQIGENQGLSVEMRQQLKQQGAIFEDELGDRFGSINTYDIQSH
ncbi:MAG: hypothetical protein IGS49_18135 [Chlorogloeopsis fritschii C42_A2020_084]|nr:hypothetical protein [Chlorogloeopsis fritschii]MBF2007324.1 hypothetical protein [Chlorogloeopsis fritschii C42_A2020_084]